MSKKVIPSRPDTSVPKKEPDKEPRVDEQIYKSGKYEITDEEDFRIDIYLRQQEKRWVISTPDQATDTHWVKFRMWSYDEELVMRKKATQYDQIQRTHFLDRDLMNRLKLQTLLKSWSFDKENPKFKLLHVNGILVDESFHAVMNLHPNILKYIIDRMNNVLEYNA
jgi:hypothetical protein